MLASVIPPGRNTTDVMFVRSTDGGLTFSAPVKVNDDPVNPNKWHWFGTFSVAPNGRLDAVWHDTRNAANNTDSQLFYSYSTDAGVTWSPNVAVSNSFNPFEGYPNQNKIGDYITIVSDETGGNVATPPPSTSTRTDEPARRRRLLRSGIPGGQGPHRRRHRHSTAPRRPQAHLHLQRRQRQHRPPRRLDSDAHSDTNERLHPPTPRGTAESSPDSAAKTVGLSW